MSHSILARSEYSYTDRFLRKKKLQKTLAPFFLLFVLVIVIVIGKQSLLGAYSVGFAGFIFFAALIWLFAFSGILRNFKGDRIFIDDNLLVFEKCMVQKDFTYYKQYTVKNIEKIEVTARHIKIHGVILFYNEGRVKLRRKLRLSAEILHADELLSFARSVQTTDPRIISATIEAFYGRRAGVEISRAKIWAGMSKAFFSLLIKRALAGLLGVAVGLLCMLAIMSGFDNTIVFLILVGSLMTGMIISGIGFLNLIAEYLPDLLFKQVLAYEGYLTAIQPVDTSNNTTRYPIVQYKGYFHVMLYEEPNVTHHYKPLSSGDIKSSPKGGQRFLLRNQSMFDGAQVNQAFEVLYLKSSKIIVAVKNKTGDV